MSRVIRKTKEKCEIASPKREKDEKFVIRVIMCKMANNRQEKREKKEEKNGVQVHGEMK
jgi:hypothetical protein